jgi:hypothetical protein
VSKLALIKLYFKEKPILDQLQKEFSMKLNTHVVLQILGLILQGINQAEPILSPTGKFWATVGISGVQLVMAVLAHLSDQQGNPLPPIKK